MYIFTSVCAHFLHKCTYFPFTALSSPAVWIIIVALLAGVVVMAALVGIAVCIYKHRASTTHAPRNPVFYENHYSDIPANHIQHTIQRETEIHSHL